MYDVLQAFCKLFACFLAIVINFQPLAPLYMQGLKGDLVSSWGLSHLAKERNHMNQNDPFKNVKNFSVKAPTKPWFHGTVIGDFVNKYMKDNLYQAEKSVETDKSVKSVFANLAQARLAGEDYIVTTPDGNEIKIILIRAKAVTNKVKFFFHGNTGALGSFRDQALRAYEHGYNSVLVSYRGFSDNTGEPSEEGILTDTQAAYNYVKNELFANTNLDIYFHGHSLGSAIALNTAEELSKKGETVNEILLHAPFASIHEMSVRHFGGVVPMGITEKLIPNAWNNLEALEVIAENYKAAGQELPQLKFFHGEKDAIIPIEQSLKLKAKAEELGFSLDYMKMPEHEHNTALEERTYQ